MYKNILGICGIVGMILFSTACSKKSTAVESDEDHSPQQRSQKKGERPSFSDLVAQMDSDKDGKISESEVKGPMKNNFAKIDENNDGFISETEFNNAPPPDRKKGPRRQ